MEKLTETAITAISLGSQVEWFGFHTMWSISHELDHGDIRKIKKQKITNCKVYSWLLNNTQKSNKICGIKRNWIVIFKTISRQKESYFLPQWPPMKSSIVFPYHFFPGLFFYVYIGSPNPNIPKGLTPQASNPINHKPQPQIPNLRPQSQNLKPQNHHKWAKIRKKIIKNNPGKKAWAALSFINRPCCSILATAYKKPTDLLGCWHTAC